MTTLTVETPMPAASDTDVETDADARDRLCHMAANLREMLLDGAAPDTTMALCGTPSGPGTRSPHSLQQCEAAGHMRCLVCLDLADVLFQGLSPVEVFQILHRMGMS